jgi:protein-disulfide isomerase
MQSETSIHRMRSWIGTVVAILCLLLVSLFVWRVVYFTQVIREGGVDLAQLNFDKNTSTISRLASQPISEQAIDVADAEDPHLGDPQAAIQIVEFADFSCPYSRESSFVLRSLAAAYPKQFYYTYRDFPIAELHPFANRAAQAGACAHAQGKFWEYHDKLYQNQQEVDDTSFDAFAQSLNLDMEKFRSCLLDGTFAEEIAKDYEDGFRAGVRGTPTFFINGQRVAGSIPRNILEQILLSSPKTP